MNKFYIYKANNLFTDENYIGVTSDFDSRTKDHIQKSYSGNGQKFQNAICTYSPEYFTWEIIDLTYSKQELALKEIYYIKEYDSVLSGYNSNRGGGFKKEIYQFSLEGNYLNTYDCLDSAANAVNASITSISHACIGDRKTCKDYYWSYDISFRRSVDNRKKIIKQFTLDNEFVNSFESISNASKFTGVNSSSIAKCCRNERAKAGDFIWEFSS